MQNSFKSIMLVFVLSILSLNQVKAVVPCEDNVYPCAEIGESVCCTECCEGLTKVVEQRWFNENCEDSELDGGCQIICVNCGDGKCDKKYESECNCSEDCNNRNYYIWGGILTLIIVISFKHFRKK